MMARNPIEIGERVSVEAILQAISEAGGASLESLLIELEAESSAIDVARAFQDARARGLIELDPLDPPSLDPVYRLSETGLT